MKFKLMIRLLSGPKVYKVFSNLKQAESYRDYLNRINKSGDVAWVEKSTELV
ncbi:MAG: hypothetical protein AAFN81_10825 [Bacteroidota bacterium]